MARMAIIKKKIYKQMLERLWRKENPSTPLMGNVNWFSTMEKSKEVP